MAVGLGLGTQHTAHGGGSQLLDTAMAKAVSSVNAGFLPFCCAEAISQHQLVIQGSTDQYLVSLTRLWQQPVHRGKVNH
jgi:hypothetical protein